MKTSESKTEPKSEPKSAKWDQSEWKALAERVAEIKAKNGSMGWFEIVYAAQDILPLGRRNYGLSGIASLAPLFQLLGLDESGNAPVPVPSPPRAEPKPNQGELVKGLTTEVLLTELATRTKAVSEQLDRIFKVVGEVKQAQAEHEQRIAVQVKDISLEVGKSDQRIKECENMVLEECNKANQAVLESRKECANAIRESFDNILKGTEEADPDHVRVLDSTAALAILEGRYAQIRQPLNGAKKPPLDVLLIGPRPADFIEIQRAIGDMNVTLACFDKEHETTVPDGYDYVLVSQRHAGPFWNGAHKKYDKRAKHIAGGNSSLIESIKALVTDTAIRS